ncbi:hypothetical protein AA313_de0207164 [Arthrobotrys entomopaga]|nr:hypothetical protein AA313_de0207164 [Arthrobotrys entomopaga]
MGDQEAIRQNTANRNKAMVKMIQLLACYPEATKNLLTKLMTDRRERYPDILPYPVNKKWAWEFLIIEVATAKQTEKERQIEKKKLENEISVRPKGKKGVAATKEEVEISDTKMVSFASKCTMPKAPTIPSIGVLPPAPFRRNSVSVVGVQSDENKREESPQRGRRMRRNSDTTRSEREGSQIPIATIPDGSKPKHRTLAPPKGILITNTTLSPPTGSQQNAGAIQDLEDPSSDKEESSDAIGSANDRGKERMSLEEEIKLRNQKKQNLQKLSLEINFLRNVKPHSGGEGYIKKRLEELEERKLQWDHAPDNPELEPGAEEFETIESIETLSSRAKALLTYGGNIVLHGCGPSTPKFRKAQSLKIFGTELIPPMQCYEFDSSPSSRGSSRSSSAASSQRRLDLSSNGHTIEKPSPPDMIIISDYDRNHQGIEIPILPEPMEESTHWEGSSLIIPRGFEVTKVLAMLVVELQRCTAYLFSSRKGYEDNLWAERVGRLLGLVDAVRYVIPERQADRPLCGSLLGEVGTLEMAVNLGHGFWAMKQCIGDMEKKIRKMEALALELGPGLDQMMKKQEKWIDERERHIESAGGDISADEETNAANAELERYMELLQKVTKIAVESREWNATWREADEIIERMGLHSVPFEKKDWENGCRPDQYAPDIEHFTAAVRGSRKLSASIGTSRAIYPSKAPVKVYYRPGQVLMTELKLDALIMKKEIGEEDRSKVRRSILPLPVGSGRERMRLPEETWDYITRPPNSAYPGRFLESNCYGVFSWSYPRESLKPFTELGLPLGRGCFRGKAIMQYGRPNVAHEQWQSNKWKSYILKDFLSRETVLKLIIATAPPTIAKISNPASRPISPNFPAGVPRGGFTSNSKVLKTQTIPDDGDDEEFIEDIADTGKQPERPSMTGVARSPQTVQTSTHIEPQQGWIAEQEEEPEPRIRVLRVMNPDIEAEEATSVEREEQPKTIEQRQHISNETSSPLTTESPENQGFIGRLLRISPTIEQAGLIFGINRPSGVLLGNSDNANRYHGLGGYGDSDGVDSD